jgi:DNA-binding response OmpR family regulator
MTVLVHTHDLLSASRIAAAAQMGGVNLLQCADRHELLRLIGRPDVYLVLLDLAVPNLVIADLVPRLRSACAGRLSIVAYGPHVDAARLTEARDAGCDRVLARGQFLAQVTTVLAKDGRLADPEPER